MPTNVAIACQGGGSHTAFTAGVLRTLLPSIEEMDCRLVGVSGTSGGAVSAAAALSGYLEAGATGAVESLDSFWDDMATRQPANAWINEWLVQGTRLQHGAVPTPTISPYDSPVSSYGKRKFMEILERHIDFEQFSELSESDKPELLIGAVDVNAGEFETFRDGEITPRSLLASCAVPTMFRAVEMDGHYHWDGLFSQNPPIHELMRMDVNRKPDELWVVQINPQTYEGEPTSVSEIVDRRNELSGNLSLNQELQFIQRVNRWIEAGDLTDEKYTHTEIRRITLDEQLDYASKLDRDPQFLERLTAEGIDTAEAFLDDLTLGEHEHDVQNSESHDTNRE